MKNHSLLFRLIVILLVIGSSYACQQKTVNTYNIIPKPLNLQARLNSFEINKTTQIIVSDKGFLPLGQHLAEMIHNIPSEKLSVSNNLEGISKNTIAILRDDAISAEEGYRLDITEDNIILKAGTAKGVFYGIQTIRQLLPAEVELSVLKNSKSLELPCVLINDEPRFSWRGMHLDVSRHFFSVDYLKKYIDYLALYKFNKFHLHLNDDQGWRLEIKKYPKLTSEGAWRTENGHDKQCNELAKTDPSFTITKEFYKDIDGKKLYGGFYTQDQMKDIIRYANDRSITIVPEIDVPGHFMSAIESYPYLSCSGEAGWGSGFSKPLCAGNEDTYEFVENILDEVAELFPCEYIHVGGDEVEKSEWKKCSKCQAIIKKEKLHDEHELQTLFMNRIEKFINSKGKRMIGWDEIMDGGLSEDATVMFWRSWMGGYPSKAAKLGNDVIMSPNSHCYFDYNQTSESLKQVYGFEPVPHNLSAEEAKHIIGAQGNIWCEWIPSDDRCDYMSVPRMIALAEVIWTSKERKDWDSFSQRMKSHYPRLDVMDVNYRQPDFQTLKDHQVFIDAITVKLDLPLENLEVRYTTNGSEPTKTSELYTGPFVISETTSLKMKVFRSNGRVSETITSTYEKQDYLEPVAVDDRQQGLECTFFKGNYRSVAALESAKPVQTTIEKGIVFPAHANGDLFGLVYKGYITIPSDGIYTFYSNSDDGSVVFIGDRKVVDHDGPHGPSEKLGQVALRKGLHPIKVLYFELGGGELLQVSYEGNGIEKGSISADQLFH